jgi:hypothetical protein
MQSPTPVGSGVSCLMPPREREDAATEGLFPASDLLSWEDTNVEAVRGGVKRESRCAGATRA